MLTAAACMLSTTDRRPWVSDLNMKEAKLGRCVIEDPGSFSGLIHYRHRGQHTPLLGGNPLESLGIGGDPISHSTAEVV